MCCKFIIKVINALHIKTYIVYLASSHARESLPSSTVAYDESSPLRWASRVVAVEPRPSRDETSRPPRLVAINFPKRVACHRYRFLNRPIDCEIRRPDVAHLPSGSPSRRPTPGRTRRLFVEHTRESINQMVTNDLLYSMGFLSRYSIDKCSES